MIKVILGKPIYRKNHTLPKASVANSVGGLKIFINDYRSDMIRLLPSSPGEEGYVLFRRGNAGERASYGPGV